MPKKCKLKVIFRVSIDRSDGGRRRRIRRSNNAAKGGEYLLIQSNLHVSIAGALRGDKMMMMTTTTTAINAYCSPMSPNIIHLHTAKYCPPLILRLDRIPGIINLTAATASAAKAILSMGIQWWSFVCLLEWSSSSFFNLQLNSFAAQKWPSSLVDGGEVETKIIIDRSSKCDFVNRLPRLDITMKNLGDDLEYSSCFPSIPLVVVVCKSTRSNFIHHRRRRAVTIIIHIPNWLKSYNYSFVSCSLSISSRCSSEVMAGGCFVCNPPFWLFPCIVAPCIVVALITISSAEQYNPPRFIWHQRAANESQEQRDASTTRHGNKLNWKAQLKLWTACRSLLQSSIISNVNLWHTETMPSSSSSSGAAAAAPPSRDKQVKWQIHRHHSATTTRRRIRDGGLGEDAPRLRWTVFSWFPPFPFTSLLSSKCTRVIAQHYRQPLEKYYIRVPRQNNSFEFTS